MSNVIDFEKRRLNRRDEIPASSRRAPMGEGRQEPIGDIVKRIVARIELERMR